MASSTTSTPSLRATYTSQTTTQTFSSALPPPPNPSDTTTETKTTYLAGLREKVSAMQDEINVFLTAKMEEDKAGDVAAKSKKDEEREEQMYGEEGAEEE